MSSFDPKKPQHIVDMLTDDQDIKKELEKLGHHVEMEQE